LIVSAGAGPKIEFFKSGRYKRDGPQLLVLGELNDIEPAHQEQRAAKDQHQWNRDLAWIEESHLLCLDHNSNGPRRGAQPIFGERRLATGERRAELS
jgi:hypothetical protein